MAVKAVFELSICERRQVPTVEEVPMSWLNLLAQEVEKATRCELVVEEVDEVNNCRVIAIWVKPKVYFLPFEVPFYCNLYELVQIMKICHIYRM